MNIHRWPFGTKIKHLTSIAGFVFVTGLLFLGLSFPKTAYAADPVLCSASMAGGISFGTIDAISSADTDTTGALNITCTSYVNTNYYVTVCFNIGDGQGPVTGGQRTMMSGSNTLNYQLFSDASRSLVWGSTTSGNFPNPVRLDFYLRKRNSYSQSIPVYGRLYGGQTSSAVGTYTDSYAPPLVRITGILSTTPGGGDCNSSGEDAGGFSGFNVTAAVRSNCLVQATDLDFGIASILSSQVTANSGIQIQCTNKTPYQVGLNNGTHSVGTTRYMMSGVNTIAYGLYQNPALTASWNNSTNRLSGTGTGLQTTLPVYGAVPAQPQAKSGIYLDTIQVNVTY